MNGWLYFFPVVAALIGWLANRLAIKMLFHPLKPKKVLGLSLQGVFPKRQKLFAEKLGKLVSKEFLLIEEIEKKISDPKKLKQVMPLIAENVDEFLRNKMGKQIPFLSMFIGDKTIESLKTVFMQEIELLFPKILKQFAGNMKEEFDLEKIIIQKVTSFSTGKLEKILYQNLSKEFRFFEKLGALTGFLIGLLLVVITFLAS